MFSRVLSSIELLFQSLDWVERLSDHARQHRRRLQRVFQSLDWVERLSDSTPLPSRVPYPHPFQSLDWVERLSDPAPCHPQPPARQFQSLDWVERLSDRYFREHGQEDRSFNPSTGLSVFQTSAGAPPKLCGRQRFNPSTGLSVFQT